LRITALFGGRGLDLLDIILGRIIKFKAKEVVVDF